MVEVFKTKADTPGPVTQYDDYISTMMISDVSKIVFSQNTDSFQGNSSEAL